ncbi:unnamed protein product [Prunus brigantina]
MILNAGVFRLYNPSFHNVVAAAYNMVGASNMGPFPNRRIYGGGVNNNPPTLAVTRGDSALDYLHGVFDPYDLAAQCQILNEKTDNVLSRLNLNDDH